MIDQRLYIDGILADIDEGTKVALSLNSNLFRDITKMVGNFSYTVKLPNTTRNRSLIAASDRVEVTSLFPYGTHTADYYRNGVGVIIGAKAVLLSTGDDIEISLSWGVTEGLRLLASEGLSLNQLKDPLTIEWRTSGYSEVIPAWSLIQNDPTASQFKILYAQSNYYRPAKDTSLTPAQELAWECLYIRPCVRVPYILRVIEQRYGITLDFSAVQNDIAFLALPLVTNKAQYASDCDTITLGFASNPSGVFFTFTIVASAGIFSGAQGMALDRLSVDTTKDVSLSYSLTGVFPRTEAERYASGCVIRLTRYNAADAEIEHTDITLSMGSTTATTATLFASGTYAAEMSAGDYLTAYFISDTLTDVELESVASGLSTGGSTMEGRIPSSEGADYSDDSPEVQPGDNYPAFPNLPEVKVVDFVKTLCVLTGTFPKNQQGNVIRFLPFATLWDNIPQAYDWTRRVEPASEIDRPRTAEYKMGDYAQNNWYRYTGEDDYNAEHDGDLPVPNTTLDLTKDFFKVPFAPCVVERVRRYVRIPIYSISNITELLNGSSNVPQYATNDVKPRIVRLASQVFYSGNTPLTIATFDGLNLQDIITTRYADVQNALAYTLVIKEKIRLSDIELKSFDETIPVYLAQYGAYFAVTEIKADSEGNADVTLFRIK